MTTLTLLGLFFFYLLLHVMKKADEGKGVWLFGVITLPLLVISFIYVGRTWVDAVFLDGFIHIPLVGRFMAGTLDFSELLIPRGEHILSGYAVLTLLNAQFLDLDMRLDPVMFVLSFLLLSAVVYLECAKILRQEKRWILALVFFPLALISFSLTAPPGILMSTQFTWGTSMALVVAWFLQNDFDRESLAPRATWPVVGALTVMLVYFLVFSGSYFPGLVFGLAGMISLRRVAERKKLDWRVGAVLLTAAVCSFLYFYRVFVAQRWPESISLPQRMVHIVHTPIDTLLTYFSGFGAGLVDQNSVVNHISTLLYLGGIMAVIAGFALWLYVRAGLHRVSYLPVFCVCYVVGIISAIRLGRSQNGDWRWIANDWYSFHLRLFGLGAAWMLLLAIVSYRRLRSARPQGASLTGWRTALALASLAFILSCHAFANYHQWSRGINNVRGWAEEKHMALLFPEFTDQSVLLWGPDEVISDRAILEKYHLSSFSAHSWNEVQARSQDGLIRFNSWYSDNWLGENASVIFFAGSSDDLEVIMQVPGFIHAAVVEVVLNGKVLFSGPLTAGQAKLIAGRVRAGRNVLTIRTDRSVVPAKAGISGDLRPLSLHINVFNLPSLVTGI